MTESPDRKALEDLSKQGDITTTAVLYLLDQPPRSATASPAIGKLVAALAEARKSFKPIKRSKEVTVQPRDHSKRSYKFKYAPYEEMVDATDAPLAAHGLVCWSSCEPGADGLRMYLGHSSGEWISCYVPMPPAGGMAPQELGSHMSYRMRYAYRHLLNLPSDEDDDANIAEMNEFEAARGKKPKPEPLAGDAPPRRGGKGDTRNSLTAQDPEARIAEYRRQIFEDLKWLADKQLVAKETLEAGDVGDIARTLLIGELLDGPFDKGSPSDWKHWAAAVAKMRVDNTPPPEAA